MPPKKINPAKTSILSLISDLYKEAKSVAVVDYKGLKVSQATQLRQAIRQAGGHFIVAKNTLFKIASGHPDLDLTGTSGFVFSTSDEVSALKVVADFAKKNGLPTFKSGFLSDKVLNASEITQLASLPDRTTLISKTVTSLNSPLFQLAYNLNWHISKLVRTLGAISLSKK